MKDASPEGVRKTKGSPQVFNTAFANAPADPYWAKSNRDTNSSHRPLTPIRLQSDDINSCLRIGPVTGSATSAIVAPPAPRGTSVKIWVPLFVEKGERLKALTETQEFAGVRQATGD
jgi:hypothetical protein